MGKMVENMAKKPELAGKYKAIACKLAKGQAMANLILPCYETKNSGNHFSC